MYECVGEDKVRKFQNIKPSPKDGKCWIVDEGPPASSGSSAKPSARAPTPSTFPKVDGNTQKARDTDRRRILESELGAEQRNLEQARKDLAAQEAARSGDERNYQKVLDRLQPFKDKAALHERNIEAINKEISNLR